jgi:phosphate transport system substrate-binding protein
MVKRMSYYQENDCAVSPIVATLVLIVVAVIGAVAVGTIMGSFSSDVSKHASAGQAAQSSATEVLMAGSPAMEVPMENVTDDYAAQHPGIKFEVQGGSGNAGLAMVAQGVGDFGMNYQGRNSAQKAAYPNVQEHIVGYEGVVVIVNSGTTVTSNVSLSDLERAFSNDFSGPTLPVGITTAVVNTGDTGTGDTFASLIGVSNIYSTVNASTRAFDNNCPAVEYVATHPGTIGYNKLNYLLGLSNPNKIDFQSNIKILTYAGTPKIHETDSFWPSYTWQSVRDAKSGVSNPLNFPVKAVGSYTLLTNGQPTSLQNSIIRFTQSPDEAARFHDLNLVHVSDVVAQ